MEREPFGGRRGARSPARGERPQDARSHPNTRYDVSSSGSRPGDRYSARYDAGGPPTQYARSEDPAPRARSRSRSRSPTRDRGAPRAGEGTGGPRRPSPRREQAHYGGRAAQSAIVFDAPPNATLIIKNLPPVVDDEMLMRELASFQPQRAHTIRDRETGVSRGFAFVSFESVEHATRVMNTFEFIPLVVADRALVLGYASSRRPGPSAHDSDHHGQFRDEVRASSDYSTRPQRFDWLCDQCNATNFSRRAACFRCFAPKAEHAREVPADFSSARGGSDPRQSAGYDSERHRQYEDRGRDRYESREDAHRSFSRSPERSREFGSQSSAHDTKAPETNVLAARQLPFDVDEGQLQVAFASCSGVRDIRLVRDRMNLSRGFAFVEFVDADAARQALETSQNLAVGGGFARLSFAYDTFHPRGQRLSYGGADDGRGGYDADYRSRREDGREEYANAIAATALEQAQWALANGYQRSAGDDPDGLHQTGIVDDVNALLNSAAEAARPRIEEPRKQWPLPFETGGGSYVYASDVGLYWDQDSMFYYSPASKLYYSVFLGKYFRCDARAAATDSAPFQEVAAPLPMDDAAFVYDVSGRHPAVQQTTDSKTAAAAAAASSTEKPGSSGGVSLSLKLPAKKKAPISFGLKASAAAGSKKLKTAVNATAADANPSSASLAAGAAPIVGAMPPAGVLRKSAQDIAKWSQVQRKTKLEEQQQVGSGGDTAAAAALSTARLPFETPSVANPVLHKPTKAPAKRSEPTAAPATVSAPSVVDALANTAVEVPICLLCRRKFKSMEVLRKHESMSAMHLENLAKARQDKEAVAAQYRERERAAAAAVDKRAREAASQEAEAKRQKLADAAANAKPAQEAKAAAALEQGIGGKMLKMMGWKSGEGLGKRGTGITAPISATGSSSGGGNSSNTAGLGARPALPPATLLDESASYKERVQSFTRARYDATGAKEL